MSALLGKVHEIRMSGLAIVKTGKVGNKFSFASYADVWEVLLPELRKHGISVGFPGSAIRCDGPLEVMSLTLNVSNGTEEKSTTFEIILPESIRNQQGSAVTNASQRSGAAASYARRTALILYFQIATGDDAEVERMTPQPGQNNIPGAIMVTNSTRWADLTDGTWRDAVCPECWDGKLCEYPDPQAPQETQEGQMKKLWTSYPNNPALMAYWADWIVQKLEEQGATWADLKDRSANLPEHIHNCTEGKQLSTACRLILGKGEK